MCSLESFEKRLEINGKTPVNLGQNAAKDKPPLNKGVLKTIKVTIHQKSHTKWVSGPYKVGNTLNAISTGYY